MDKQNVLTLNATDIPSKEEKKRERVQKRAAIQPKFSLSEELFNSISHGLGVIFGIFVLVFGCVTVSENPSVLRYTAVIIYAVCIIILYLMSCLYHAFPQGKAKRVFRIFDHCTIFLLIAGTYTPFCLIAFGGTVLGYTILAAEWVIAVAGIALNGVNMYWKAVKIVSMVGYFVMGWCIIFAMPALMNALSTTALIYLLCGGVAYTLGIIFYGVGSKKKYFHCVWHIFVLAGTALQFISIYLML